MCLIRKQTMTFRPLGNKIIVEPLKKQDEVVNGILLSAAQLGEGVLKGAVVAVGPEATVKVGEEVAFARFGFDEIRDGMKVYYVLPEELVHAVIS